MYCDCLKTLINTERMCTESEDASACKQFRKAQQTKQHIFSSIDAVVLNFTEGTMYCCTASQDLLERGRSLKWWWCFALPWWRKQRMLQRKTGQWRAAATHCTTCWWVLRVLRQCNTVTLPHQQVQLYCHCNSNCSFFPLSPCPSTSFFLFFQPACYDQVSVGDCDLLIYGPAAVDVTLQLSVYEVLDQWQSVSH